MATKQSKPAPSQLFVGFKRFVAPTSGTTPLVGLRLRIKKHEGNPAFKNRPCVSCAYLRTLLQHTDARLWVFRAASQ